MLVLTIRTDKPEAELGLYEGQEQLAYTVWLAHRELSVGLLTRIQGLLDGQGKTIHDIQGIACLAGPGSFTGLRIGLTVANALAVADEVPIVAREGDDWLAQAITALEAGENDQLAMPEYGAPVHITAPKK